jgi:hypothetical protein
MSKIVGQKPWKKPMQCWGCGRNHMHRGFARRGDKVRTVNSVKEDATIEYIGINVPRIYTTLDNRHA